jgi:hypothetical protein
MLDDYLGLSDSTKANFLPENYLLLKKQNVRDETNDSFSSSHYLVSFFIFRSFAPNNSSKPLVTTPLNIFLEICVPS